MSKKKHMTKSVKSNRSGARERVPGKVGIGSADDASPAMPPGRDIDYGPLPSLVGYQVRKAYSRLFQTFTEMLAGIGVAPGQYSALLLIGLNPGLSQMALADAAGIDRSSIVPITNHLAKAGWIRRTRRSEDRRIYSLRLTSAGKKVLDDAAPLIERHEKQLVAALSDTERSVLRSLLARIADSEEQQLAAVDQGQHPRDVADSGKSFAPRKRTAHRL